MKIRLWIPAAFVIELELSALRALIGWYFAWKLYTIYANSG